MSVKTRQRETHALYFVTFTCYRWIPLFEITNLYDNIYKLFNYLKTKEIKICGYLISPQQSLPLGDSAALLKISLIKSPTQGILHH